MVELAFVRCDDNEAHITPIKGIDAALCGYEYSGLAKILNIPETKYFKLPRRPMKLLRETDVSPSATEAPIARDAHVHFYAAEATIKKADAHGIALVS